MPKKFDRRSIFFDPLDKFPLIPTAGPWTRTDTVAATTSTAASLAVGASTRGTIDVGGDFDWYRVNLVAGYSYRIALEGAGSGAGTLGDGFLRVRDGGGVEIASDDDSGDGLDSFLFFTPTTTGRHFIDAGGYGFSTGGFRLSLRATDIAGGVGTTAEIALGQTYDGVIDVANDVDWYRVRLAAGRTYVVEMQGAGGGAGTLADPIVEIRAANGALLASNDDGGAGLDALLTYRATRTGVHYVAADGFGSATGDFTLRFAEADIAADTATLGRIALGAAQTGRIDAAGDQDWFAVNLAAGGRYRVDLTSDQSLGAGLADPFFRGVRDAAGRLLAGTTNDDYGGSYDAQVTFTATAAGRYFLAAGAFGSGVGGYQLRVAALSGGASDAVGATPQSAARIALGATGVAGVIDTARDVDWFAVTLAANRSYVIDQLGAASGSGSLADPYFVGVYTAGGDLIPGSGNDDFAGVLDSRTVFTPTVAGAYYLAAGGYFNQTGTYRLKIAAASTDADIPDNALSRATVAVGGRRTSTIERGGDVDWIGVTLVGGRTYRVDQLGGPAGGRTLADPEIEGVYRANGAVVPGTADGDGGDGANARVTFTAPVSGKYFIAAGSAEDRLGSYAVTVTQTTDARAPVRVAASPADGATGVAVGQNLTLTFDEAVRRGDGHFVISGGGQTLRLNVDDARQVSISGETVTLNPAAALRANAAYTVTYGAGVVEDLAGNDAAALRATTAWNFRTAPAVSAPADSWTIMVYIAGDNNLEPFALSDLNEMESVNLPASCNVVVLADRAPGYATGSGDWTNTRQGAIVYDGANPTVTSLAAAATSQGELNTGSGATLTRFINQAAAAKPAQNYALILWDHGGGTSGVAWDDSSGGDNLTMRELRLAIDASRVDSFDLIGFDACLMAMTEQASELRGLAEVMVASEDLEPGDGWDYRAFLSALRSNPTMSAEQLAASIVSTYAASYAGQSDITLSALRMSGLAVLETRLDAFVARALSLPGTGADWRAMRAAAEDARPFPSDGSEAFADLVDFMDAVAAGAANAALRTAARSVSAAVDSAILAEGGSVGDAHGLSIYLPHGADRVDPDYDAASYAMLARVDWDDFLAVL